MPVVFKLKESCALYVPQYLLYAGYGKHLRPLLLIWRYKAFSKQYISLILVSLDYWKGEIRTSLQLKTTEVHNNERFLIFKYLRALIAISKRYFQQRIVISACRFLRSSTPKYLSGNIQLSWQISFKQISIFKNLLANECAIVLISKDFMRR